MGELMNANHEEDLLIAERAAQWLERLKSAGPEERAEFCQWLKESRRNVREVLLATTWDALSNNIDPDHRADIQALMGKSSENVVRGHWNRPSLLRQLRPDMTQPPLGQGARWPWIVSVGVSLSVLAFLIGGSRATLEFFWPNQYGTIVGEQRAIELTDGSIIHLNTQSRVRVAFTQESRDVYLSEGQAIFKVKHDAMRPFRVHVGEAVIQAIGTQFDVRRLADRTNVAVIDGLVQIIARPVEDSDPAALAHLPASTRIPAGEEASIVIDGRITPHQTVDAVEVNAWQQRRLIFRKNTLAEIVAEFNRYNRKPQLRVEGAALQARRFSGVFDADDPESLLMYLKSDSELAFDREGRRLTIRQRSSSDDALAAKGE